jgi:hypothetical protein
LEARAGGMGKPIFQKHFIVFTFSFFNFVTRSSAKISALDMVNILDDFRFDFDKKRSFDYFPIEKLNLFFEIPLISLRVHPQHSTNHLVDLWYQTKLSGN